MAVQPFVPVTVTVYVPAAVTVNAALFPTFVVPFDHEYVPPPVAVNCTEVVVQVITVLEGKVMETTGAAVFCVMICVAVAVHPIAAVTVTV